MSLSMKKTNLEKPTSCHQNSNNDKAHTSSTKKGKTEEKWDRLMQTKAIYIPKNNPKARESTPPIGMVTIYIMLPTHPQGWQCARTHSSNRGGLGTHSQVADIPWRFYSFAVLLLLMARIEPNPGPIPSLEGLKNLNLTQPSEVDDSLSHVLETRKRSRDSSGEFMENSRRPRTESQEIHEVMQYMQSQIQFNMQGVLLAQFAEFQPKLQSMNSHIYINALAIGAVQSLGVSRDARIRSLEQEIYSHNLILFKPVGTESLEEGVSSCTWKISFKTPWMPRISKYETSDFCSTPRKAHPPLF